MRKQLNRQSSITEYHYWEVWEAPEEEMTTKEEDKEEHLHLDRHRRREGQHQSTALHRHRLRSRLHHLQSIQLERRS